MDGDRAQAGGQHRGVRGVVIVALRDRHLHVTAHQYAGHLFHGEGAGLSQLGVALVSLTPRTKLGHVPLPDPRTAVLPLLSRHILEVDPVSEHRPDEAFKIDL